MDVFDKILFNLQTLSAVSRGDRLNTSKEFITIIEGYSVYHSVSRMYTGDSRDRTVMVIRNEVACALKMAEFLMENRYIHSPELIDGAYNNITQKRIKQLSKLHLGLNNAALGIIVLCNTYAIDANIVGQLSPLINEINLMTDSIEKLLSGVVQ
jgi:hypothetical protein